MAKKLEPNEEIAIKVENLSKRFKIPHEKTTSLKSTAINLLSFKKKSYEIFQALKDVNFQVRKGEFFGIIGRNGSGKSTLLKILAGIYVPNSGKITIDGKLSPFLELGVGFNPELTARDNIFLGGAILGLSKAEIADKFDKIVHFAELEEFIDMKFKNFSSGMQVRLAFALSINAHAEILLMDEVLAVGDTNFQAKCIDEFNRYKKEGKTVVLVTHDITTVQRYCGRAMLLRNGIVESVGPAKDVANLYLENNIADFKTAENMEDIGLDSNIIAGVKFLDNKGKKKSLFNYNEDITVELTLRRNNNDKLNYGIALFQNEDSYVYGTNSFVDSYAQQLTGKVIKLTYKNPGLKGGIYHVKVAIFGENEQRALQYLNKSEIFRVAENSGYEGCINLDHIWS